MVRSTVWVPAWVGEATVVRPATVEAEAVPRVVRRHPLRQPLRRPLAVAGVPDRPMRNRRRTVEDPDPVAQAGAVGAERAVPELAMQHRHRRRATRIDATVDPIRRDPRPGPEDRRTGSAGRALLRSR
jgi:hypothetical protein